MNEAKFSFDTVKTSGGFEFVFASSEADVAEIGVAGYSEQVINLPAGASIGQTEKLESSFLGKDQGRFTGGKVSLDFKDADILDVLRLMSEISKLNIIAGDDVKGTITVRLINIPWDEALAVILRSKSLGKERFGNIIRVASLRTLQSEKEAELAKIKAQQKLDPLKVRLLAVNYAVAAELMPKIKELLTERGSISADERTNVLVVKDVEEVLDKAEQLKEYLDTQTPQVLIEARIVEATAQATEGMGVEWGANGVMDVAHGNPTGMVFPYNMGVGGAVDVPVSSGSTGALGFSFGSIGNVANLNLTLSVLETEGKIKIVSSPKIATLDHIEAMIKQGVKIPITTLTAGADGGASYTTQYIDATLELKTTPHITADGSVLMTLEIKKEEPDWSNKDLFGHPAMITKEAKTDVMVKSGDTVVIGGVYTNKQSVVKHGVPFFSDIPMIGWLFKYEEESVERSELLIFLTPRIMNKVKSSVPLQTIEEES